MDLHIVPGVKAKEAAEAHRQDVLLEEAYGCRCMTYWIDEPRGHVFCLIEAPNAESVTHMHAKAHGLVPHKIVEVQPDLVASFLGRVSDPEDAERTDTGLIYFHDPSFRILLCMYVKDIALLQGEYGTEKAKALLSETNKMVNRQITLHNGSRVEHPDCPILASFGSARHALACARGIHAEMLITHTADILQPGIALHGGEPLSEKDELFGDTLSFIRNICQLPVNKGLVISSVVKDVLTDEHLHDMAEMELTLSPADEVLLTEVFGILSERATDADFGTDALAAGMAMSQPTLYRKVLTASGLSPNNLIRWWRLQLAKTLLRRQNASIGQIAFACGFNSPSYFTKCFREAFGLLPVQYMEAI